MVPAKDLFRLLQSLTMSEKRYFKLMLSQQAGPAGTNYVRLFDAIAGQKEYDEGRIRHELKGQIKNFSATKLQLYHLLLRSLRLYHARSTVENELSESLQNIEILYNKGLYPECSNLIKKARKTASLYSNHLVSLELISWEVRIMRELKYERISREQLEEMHRKEMELLKQYKTISICRHSANLFFYLHLKNVYVRSPRSAKEFRAGMDFSLLRKKEVPPAAKIIMYFTVSGYFMSTGDYKKCYQYNKQLLLLLESISHQTSEIQRYYAHALINMCIVVRELRRFDELDQTLAALGRLTVNTERLAVAIACFSYHMKGNVLIYHGDFKGAQNVMREVIVYINKNKNKIDNATLQVLRYQIAYTYFGNAQFSHSLAWTNMLLNNRITDRRMDIFLAARLLHVMSHIEKGNFDVAAHLGRSFDRFLHKIDSPYRIEKAMISFFSNKLYLAAAPSSSGKKIGEVFREFKPIAEKILRNPFEKNLLDYIDLPGWIESKIENKPFAEVVAGRKIKK